MLSNEPEHGFDEDVGELLRGEARGLRDELLPFGFKGPVRLLEEREDNRILATFGLLCGLHVLALLSSLQLPTRVRRTEDGMRILDVAVD
jgi:hypothetical protein